jgi:hypothetical protein
MVARAALLRESARPGTRPPNKGRYRRMALDCRIARDLKETDNRRATWLNSVIVEVRLPQATAGFLSCRKIANAPIEDGQLPISRLSMSRSLVSRFCSLFFLHRAFAVVAGFVALHRVSIRTLGELS